MPKFVAIRDLYVPQLENIKPVKLDLPEETSAEAETTEADTP